jgi:hypothetical protein
MSDYWIIRSGEWEVDIEPCMIKFTVYDLIIPHSRSSSLQFLSIPSLSIWPQQDTFKLKFLLEIFLNMATLHADVVPGTVHLVDLGGDMHTQHLDGNKEIVLVPKPSSDPEDPLNWTRKRKMLSICMCYVYTLGIGISTAVQYSGSITDNFVWMLELLT